MTLLHQLAHALKRVVPFLDLVPKSAAAEVRLALARYEAEKAIVQTTDGAKEQVRESIERWHSNCPGCKCDFPP